MTNQKKGNDENLRLGSENVFILKTYRFLCKIGINKPGNIYAGLKHRSWKWFIDGFFGNNFVYISNEKYVGAKKMYEYFINKEYYKNLIEGLDYESIQFINHYSNTLNYILGNRGLCLPKELVSISNNPANKGIMKNIKKYTKGLYMPIELLPEVRFYKHGIKLIPNILKYTKGKDVIDCGAFIGDSALMLDKELNVNKIFSCEPDPKNFKILNKVIKKNHREDKIIPINLGVGLKRYEVNFDKRTKGCSGIRENLIIKIDTIDNIVIDNNINPGLIKRDIEGVEYDSLLGAEKTIKKYKPILVISIYHTPKDFFEIKPFLESWNLGYKFKIVHCTEGTNGTEIMLLAYID